MLWVIAPWGDQSSQRQDLPPHHPGTGGRQGPSWLWGHPHKWYGAGDWFMPTSSNTSFSQQTQPIGETSGKQPQWGSLDFYPHCPVATSLAGQSQLYQGPYAPGERAGSREGWLSSCSVPTSAALPWQGQLSDKDDMQSWVLPLATYREGGVAEVISSSVGSCGWCSPTSPTSWLGSFRNLIMIYQFSFIKTSCGVTVPAYWPPFPPQPMRTQIQLPRLTIPSFTIFSVRSTQPSRPGISHITKVLLGDNHSWLGADVSDLGPIIRAGLLHLAEGSKQSSMALTDGGKGPHFLSDQAKTTGFSSPGEKEMAEDRRGREDWTEKAQWAHGWRKVLANPAEVCGSQDCKLWGLSQGEHEVREVQDWWAEEDP